LPFRLKPTATTVENTPLAELQALCFVIDELGLYLDTHPEDSEAFSLYQSYTALEQEGRAAYVRRYGPLEQTDAALDDQYTWLNDPWPWEGGKR
jgi:spore coat protein JB